MMQGMGRMGSMMAAMSWFGWLLSILVIVLIVWLVMSILHQRNEGMHIEDTHTTVTGSSTDALEQAKQRYAQGEIDRETFLQIKKDLAQH